MAPSQCGGTTPECCGTAVLNGGTVPNCSVATLSSQCVAKCISNISLTCGSTTKTVTDTLHMCATPADCTTSDPGNPDCCLVHGYYVCVSALDKTLGGLTCQ
ncbi:MAG TPA: hypothetical protein VMI75_12275 [Polyangiaceae bacterium]|nr:hypothetical protein [Polyangiaceae bacterium]